MSLFRKLSYDVNDYFYVSLKDRPADFLNKLQKNGSIEESLMLALDFFCSAEPKQKSAGDDFLSRKLPVLFKDSQKIKIFIEMINGRMNYYLNEKYTSSALDKIRNIAHLLLQKINEIDNAELLHLKERCLYYLVHCEAHEGMSTGSENKSYSEQYDSFFREKGHIIYPSLPDRIHKRLETKLISVQTLYFNSFLFDELSSEFIKDLEEYENGFNLYHKTEKTDDIYARLCGTYGQAIAFQGSVSKDDMLIKSSIDY